MTDTKDPLRGYRGLSLFPRTFASLPNPPQPHDFDDRHFIHNLLKFMPVQNPDKLVEQAKNILDDTTEVPNVKMINDADSEENNEVVADMAVKYPRGQRPGLQRKCPRFSLLPNISQPTVDLEPTLDLDKLKDPEEFFLAYERHENARKEIAKQTGRSFTNSDQYNVFMVPQSQRPGILGRSKTAKYKHLFSAMPFQESREEYILSNFGSQRETTQPDVASQQTEQASVTSKQLKSTNDESEEMELTGSIAKAENRVNQLIDELLAHDYGELERDRAVDLLQEHFQIKPLHIDKLSLPEMQSIQRIDFKVCGVNLSKSRNISADIDNLLKRTRNTTPMELKNMGNSVPSFDSPTPPKSPLASLSLLKKHILQSNPSSDPFSFNDIDQSPARNASPAKSVNEYSDLVCISDKLKSPTTEEDDVTIGCRNSTEVAMEESTSSFEKHVNENVTSLGSGSEVGPGDSGSELENNKVDMGNESINENLSRADTDVDLLKSGPDDLEHIVEDVLQEAVASAQPDENTDDFPVETSNSIQNGLDQSNPAPADRHAVNECPEIQDGSPLKIKKIAPEEQTKKLQEPSKVSTKKQRKRKLQSRKGRYKFHSHRARDNKALSRRQGLSDPAMAEFRTVNVSAECMDDASVQTQGTPSKLLNKKIQVSMNEQTKGKSRLGKERKSKNLSSRQSLAGCGMSWDTGVRRSTRIRSRPLEFWKGERFLYGRIHQSLATIIGIKYESPGKENGGPTMKVKSFVSNEFKDLVEQAALY